MSPDVCGNSWNTWQLAGGPGGGGEGGDGRTDTSVTYLWVVQKQLAERRRLIVMLNIVIRKVSVNFGEKSRPR